MTEETRIKILFLCTGNSCRSQMAEGFVRQLKSHAIDAYSAGISPKEIDPLAVKAMAEAGIDISGQKSNSVDDVKHIDMDYVVTLCDNAQKTCPSFPAKTAVRHVAFDDPPRLATGAIDEVSAMPHYRRVRDEIRCFVEQFPDALTGKESETTLNEEAMFLKSIRAGLRQMPEGFTQIKES